MYNIAAGNSCGALCDVHVTDGTVFGTSLPNVGDSSSEPFLFNPLLTMPNLLQIFLWPLIQQEMAILLLSIFAYYFEFNAILLCNPGCWCIDTWLESVFVLVTH